MSMQDPIADMLTRIRNGQLAGHANTSMPSSKQKVAIAEVLKTEGFIKDYAVESGAKPELTIELKYHNGARVIERLEQVSLAAYYKSAGELPKVQTAWVLPSSLPLRA